MPVPGPEHPSAWSCCVDDIFLVHRPEPAQPLIVSSLFIRALFLIHPALSFRLLCLPVEGNKACLYDYQWILVRYHSSWYSWSEHRFPPKRTSLQLVSTQFDLRTDSSFGMPPSPACRERLAISTSLPECNMEPCKGLHHLKMQAQFHEWTKSFQGAASDAGERKRVGCENPAECCSSGYSVE